MASLTLLLDHTRDCSAYALLIAAMPRPSHWPFRSGALLGGRGDPAEHVVGGLKDEWRAFLGQMRAIFRQDGVRVSLRSGPHLGEAGIKTSLGFGRRRQIRRAPRSQPGNGFSRACSAAGLIEIACSATTEGPRCASSTSGQSTQPQHATLPFSIHGGGRASRLWEQAHTGVAQTSPPCPSATRPSRRPHPLPVVPRATAL